jgi:uncharacterized protein
VAALLAIVPGHLLIYLGSFVLIAILGGPLLEEPGWRGFALPRLQLLHGPFLGTLILGLLWALWHLPEFMVPSWAAQSGGSDFFAIVKFVLIAISFAIVITWVFNNTRGSVFIAILVHASIDDFGGLLSVPFSPSDTANIILVSFGPLALLLLALTRGRLGYQNYRQEEEPDAAAAKT